MGIYDRDYYREAAPRWGGGLGSPGTIFLMGMTIGLFFLQALTTRPRRTSELLDWGEFHFDKILQGEVWRIFTAGVIPSPGLFGIILSMILLYWAGNELERVYGTRAFVAFYLLAAWLTSLAKLLIGFAGIDTAVPSVGTGGAIFAVMVLFACSNPRRTILVFFVLPMPIALLVGILLIVTVLTLLSDETHTKVHAVGVIAGAAFGFLFYKLGPGILNWIHTSRPRARRRSPIRLYNSPPLEEERERSAPVHEETRPGPLRTPRSVDEQLEAKLDQVLSKMAQHGRASLTAEELDILQKASDIYKNKRS